MVLPWTLCKLRAKAMVLLRMASASSWYHLESSPRLESHAPFHRGVRSSLRQTYPLSARRSFIAQILAFNETRRPERLEREILEELPPDPIFGVHDLLRPRLGLAEMLHLVCPGETFFRAIQMLWREVGNAAW